MTRTVRFAAVLAAIALVATACGSVSDGTAGGTGTTTPPPTETAGTSTVKVVDIAYDPVEVTIKAGDTVRWTWDGDLQHSVTADDGTFDSGLHAKGHTFEQTFDSTGRIEYFCMVHSTATGTTQNGVVIVE